jgi:hypothetical protein
MLSFNIIRYLFWFIYGIVQVALTCLANSGSNTRHASPVACSSVYRTASDKIREFVSCADKMKHAPHENHHCARLCLLKSLIIHNCVASSLLEYVRGRRLELWVQKERSSRHVPAPKLKLGLGVVFVSLFEWMSMWWVQLHLCNRTRISLSI